VRDRNHRSNRKVLKMDELAAGEMSEISVNAEISDKSF
jgi:hypothetical protein